MFLWHVRRSPIAKKIHEPKTLNRKFKRQGVYFFLHKINQMVLPLWNAFKDIFSLDKFWSPMFKYLMGVFLHANNKYHTSFIMYTHIGFQISFQSISKYNHNSFKIASIVCSAWEDGHVGLNNNYCAKASQRGRTLKFKTFET